MTRPMFLSPQPKRPGRLDTSGAVVIGLAIIGSAVTLGGWAVMLLAGIFGFTLSYGESLWAYALLLLLFILLPSRTTTRQVPK